MAVYVSDEFLWSMKMYILYIWKKEPKVKFKPGFWTDSFCVHQALVRSRQVEISVLRWEKTCTAFTKCSPFFIRLLSICYFQIFVVAIFFVISPLNSFNYFLIFLPSCFLLISIRFSIIYFQMTKSLNDFSIKVIKRSHLNSQLQ